MASPFAQTNSHNPLDGTPAPNNAAPNPLDGAKPAQQQQQPTQVPGLPNSNQVPNQHQAEGNKSPLDKFNDVFQDTPVGGGNANPDPNNPQQQQQKKEEEKLDFLKGIPDANKVSEVFGKKNFLPEGAEEAAAKALKGDAVALLELIQGAVRSGSANAAHVSLSGSATHMNNNLESLQNQTKSKTQTELRAAGLYGQMMQKYPHLNNEIVSPQIKATINRFIERRGDQTDQELANSISELLEYTYKAGATSDQASNNGAQDEEENWLSL